MTQNANEEEKFPQKSFISKKFGIQINYGHLVDNFKSFLY